MNNILHANSHIIKYIYFLIGPKASYTFKPTLISNIHFLLFVH